MCVIASWTRTPSIVSPCFFPDSYIAKQKSRALEILSISQRVDLLPPGELWSQRWRSAQRSRVRTGGDFYGLGLKWSGDPRGADLPAGHPKSCACGHVTWLQPLLDANSLIGWFITPVCIYIYILPPLQKSTFLVVFSFFVFLQMQILEEIWYASVNNMIFLQEQSEQNTISNYIQWEM